MDEPQYSCQYIDKAIEQMEEARGIADSLREWGKYWKQKAEENESEVDELGTKVSELESEVEELKSQVFDLKARLESSQEESSGLELQVEQLERRLAE